MMPRTLAALAKVDGRVTIFSSNRIALYDQGFHEAGDGLWSMAYPAPDQAMPLGEGRVYEEGADDPSSSPTATACRMSSVRRARDREATGWKVRTVDLCWLVPRTNRSSWHRRKSAKRIVVVDEGATGRCRRGRHHRDRRRRLRRDAAAPRRRYADTYTPPPGPPSSVAGRCGHRRGPPSAAGLNRSNWFVLAGAGPSSRGASSMVDTRPGGVGRIIEGCRADRRGLRPLVLDERAKWTRCGLVARDGVSAVRRRAPGSGAR